MASCVRQERVGAEFANKSLGLMGELTGRDSCCREGLGDRFNEETRGTSWN